MKIFNIHLRGRNDKVLQVDGDGFKTVTEFADWLQKGGDNTEYKLPRVFCTVHTRRDTSTKSLNYVFPLDGVSYIEEIEVDDPDVRGKTKKRS